MKLRIIGERGKRYDVKDSLCIGRTCLHLGEYQHRSPTSSGSRNTGDYSCCCMNRAYRGCPQPIPEFDPEVAKSNKAEGVRKA